MEQYSLMSLVTNEYKTTHTSLLLKRSNLPTLYVVVLDGAVPMAPTYPEGYLSIDLLRINHIIWSGDHRVFCQCTLSRRFFELSFAVASDAIAFVTSLKDIKAGDLIEIKRSSQELDIISSTWPSGRTDAATLDRESLDSCVLLRTRSASPTDESDVTICNLSDVLLRLNLRMTSVSPAPSQDSICGSLVEECHNSGEELVHRFKTEMNSDLTVVAGAHHFKVHKASLIPRSAFFATALDGQSEEAETAIIIVEDSPEVMETILQHIYGQRIHMNSRNQAASFTVKAPLEQSLAMKYIIDIYVAAKKYGISDLQDMTIKAFRERLPWLSKPQLLTALANYLYASTPVADGQVCKMRETIIEFTDDHLKAVLQDPGAASDLFEQPSLMSDMLKRSAERRPTPNNFGTSVKRVREEISDEATDERRGGLRLKLN